MFIRNVLTLASGTAFSHVLLMLSAPVLSRIYEPSTFGLLGVFVAITGTISVVANLRYEMTIVIPSDDEQAARLLALSILISVCVGLLIVPFIVFFGHNISMAFGSPELTAWLWLSPASVIALGTYQALSYWAIRKKHFRRLSISQVFKATGQVGAQVGGGLGNLGTLGLLGGHIIGQILAAIVLSVQVWVEDGKLIAKQFNPRNLLKVARKYADFPIYSAPQGLVSSFSQNFTLFFLALYFDTSTVGHYMLATRVLKLPILFVSQSINQVFFQRASETVNQGADTYPFTLKTTLILGAVAFPPALAVFLFGPQLFEYILGAEWTTAGIYTRWLILWLYFQFINPPAMTLYRVLRQERKHLIIVSTLLVARVGGLIICGILNTTDIFAIAVFSAISALFNLVLILVILFEAQKSSRQEGFNEAYDVY